MTWHSFSIFLHSHDVWMCVCVCRVANLIDGWKMTGLPCKSCHAFSYLSAWKMTHASKSSLLTHRHTHSRVHADPYLRMYTFLPTHAGHRVHTVLWRLCHAGWCVSAALAPTDRQDSSIRQETQPHAGGNTQMSKRGREGVGTSHR